MEDFLFKRRAYLRRNNVPSQQFFSCEKILIYVFIINNSRVDRIKKTRTKSIFSKYSWSIFGWKFSSTFSKIEKTINWIAMSEISSSPWFLICAEFQNEDSLAKSRLIEQKSKDNGSFEETYCSFGDLHFESSMDQYVKTICLQSVFSGIALMKNGPHIFRTHKLYKLQQILINIKINTIK